MQPGAIAELWPLSESFEYAAELGLSIRMRHPGWWREFDSPALRQELGLPQALGYAFLRGLERNHEPELRSELPQAIATSAPRVKLELDESWWQETRERGLPADPDPLPDPPEARIALAAAAGEEGLFERAVKRALEGVEVEDLAWHSATDRELALAHASIYIEGLSSLKGSVRLGPESIADHGTLTAARESAGASRAAAAFSATARRHSLVVGASGSQHAESSRAGRGCLLNGVAAGAAALIDQRMARRVAVLSVGSRHAVGTQEILNARSDIFTIQVHAQSSTGFASELGSGRGRHANVNAVLSSHQDWPATLALIRGILTRFKGEVIVLSLCLDVHRSDPSSRLDLSDRDFADLGAMLAPLGTPVVVSLEPNDAPRAVVGGLRSLLGPLA